MSSQSPAGPDTSNGPIRQPQAPNQPSMCPMTPVMAASSGSPQQMPTVPIYREQRLPWILQLQPPSVATQPFNITGCMSDFATSSKNNVRWMCPRVTSDSDGQAASLQMLLGAALVDASPSSAPSARATFDHLTEGRLMDCFPRQPGQLPLPSPSPANEPACEKCQPHSTAIQRVPLPRPDRSRPPPMYLHGCLTAGSKKVCSWLDLPSGMPCLASNVVSHGFACDQNRLTNMPSVDVLHDMLMSVDLISVTPPNVPPTLVDPPTESSESRRWVAIGVPLLGFVVGMALGGFFLVHRRRRRHQTQQDSHSHPLAYPSTPNAPPSSHSVSHFSPRPPVLATPAPQPLYSPPPAPTVPTFTRTSLPRLFDTTGLELIPLLAPPAASALPAGQSAADSLQSLTDAWESLFLRLEHECTQAARAALPAASIAAVRQERNARMARVMAHVWAVLAHGTAASAPEEDVLEGVLAKEMREVMQRISLAYPTFEMMGVALGVAMRPDALVEYVGSEATGAAGGHGQGPKRVAGMAWPGWFDAGRQLVVVKVRVVVE